MKINQITAVTESNEKIGGRHDPEEFDAMVRRVGQRAQQGKLKTVWDPVKQVYRNVPAAADPKTDVAEQAGVCPTCGGPAFADLLLAEKKDACYNKVRSRYKVWPSAYASGALVQCRKKGAANWGTGGKKK